MSMDFGWSTCGQLRMIIYVKEFSSRSGEVDARVGSGSTASFIYSCTQSSLVVLSSPGTSVSLELATSERHSIESPMQRPDWEPDIQFSFRVRSRVRTIFDRVKLSDARCRNKFSFSRPCSYSTQSREKRSHYVAI